MVGEHPEGSCVPAHIEQRVRAEITRAIDNSVKVLARHHACAHHGAQAIFDGVRQPAIFALSLLPGEQRVAILEAWINGVLREADSEAPPLRIRTVAETPAAMEGKPNQ